MADDPPRAADVLRAEGCDEDRAEEYVDALRAAGFELTYQPTTVVHSTGVVEIIDDDAEVPGRMTCGVCGRSWDDSVPTAWTPVPSARCPFEYEHLTPLDASRHAFDALVNGAAERLRALDVDDPGNAFYVQSFVVALAGEPRGAFRWDAGEQDFLPLTVGELIADLVVGL